VVSSLPAAGPRLLRGSAERARTPHDRRCADGPQALRTAGVVGRARPTSVRVPPRGRAGRVGGGGVDQLGRAGAVVPLAVIALFALLDFAAGPDRALLGLVVIAPLLAASVAGRVLTAGYAALALVVAALLGVYDEQYTAEAWPTQAAQLFGVVLGGVFAIGACDVRLQREDRLRQLSAEVARMQTRAREAERTASLAEALQRSLLTEPPSLPHLEIAVRYLPAAEHVRIGGDWYDAFAVPGGRTALVIGDVAGHDGRAATTMAQIRNTLRGIAHVLPDPPARVLGALDRAMRALSPGALATVVLVEVPAVPAGAPVPVRWSNAGHPPPLLVGADGTTRWLERAPDVLLGVVPDAVRSDHDEVLDVGDTVVLFTDGLVERRGRTVDEGLHRVRETAAAVADRPLETLCDALLTRFPARADDDIAILAVRVRTAAPA
jgi:serine phosphatase RsbU (regulator of sigma subunit)